jgi:hypothetical protein
VVVREQSVEVCRVEAVSTALGDDRHHLAAVANSILQEKN